ncbi:glutamate-cysteine ligase family protein [Paractinoplanes atraurantiacus]|uniref:glutamate--cysteine ligase n=1 Tax=Paractinoplanes atraurantiacus TaxID=1036182 RepID=A0A285K521_9ACTN|nr:glutamate-cysteine ligase family protein [Actinoplanes atraurantiacus]SNY66431.1 Glutamate-cysteine ligase family 2(GCS2) [Actinoplanes atraurantiacus]
MTTLTERAAELLLASHAFDPATPGFVGASLELPVAAAPSHRVPLRHGFLDARSARVAVVSGPPSPGLAACLDRIADDLAATSAAGFAWPTAPLPIARVHGSAQLLTDDGRLRDNQTQPRTDDARTHAGEPQLRGGDSQLRNGEIPLRVGGTHLQDGKIPLRDGNTQLQGGGSPLRAGDAQLRDGDIRLRAGESPSGAGGIRVALEAGLDAGGPLGLERRWALAHTLAPVLAAAFANSPLLGGEPSGWRSVRQARNRDLPVLPVEADARRGWARFVLDAPGRDGRTFRERARSGERPRLADLAEHVESLRPPVAARGHLEIDVADRQPGRGWRVVVAVTTVLLDDPRAASAAELATATLAVEPGLWERAARDALTDPVLAAAARECFVEAYAALARHGADRDLRDAVADFTDRYVMRARCPADDVLGAHVVG